MGTCVSIYWHTCSNGGTRIFGIHDGDKHVGTCELRLSGSRWSKAQFRGKHNAEITDRRLRLAAAQLARRYTRAWRATPEDERHTVVHRAPEQNNTEPEEINDAN